MRRSTPLTCGFQAKLNGVAAGVLTASAYAVEARAIVVLDFLTDFIRQWLFTALPQEEAISAETDLFYLTERITEISKFVQVRMQRLRETDLKDREKDTIMCPYCDNWAIITSNGPYQTCLLCTYDWGVDELLRYLEHANPSTEAASACPDCGSKTFPAQLAFLDDPDTPRPFCFACAGTGVHYVGSHVQ